MRSASTGPATRTCRAHGEWRLDSNTVSGSDANSVRSDPRCHRRHPRQPRLPTPNADANADTNADADPDPTPTPTPGTPCSPGFWKTHENDFKAFCQKAADLVTTDKFTSCQSLFNAIDCQGSNASCGRQAAAALLNAVSGCVED